MKIALYIIFGFSILIAACSSEESFMEVETRSNSSADNGMSFFESLKFSIRDDITKYCESSNLRPYSTVLKEGALKSSDKDIQFGELVGDELSEAVIEFASEIHDDISAYDAESITMHYFQIASDQGSVVADAEIGAANLYCYQHVKQDTYTAQKYLQRASDAGDPYSQIALARAYYSEIIASDDPKALALKYANLCKGKLDECDEFLAKIK